MWITHLDGCLRFAILSILGKQFFESTIYLVSVLSRTVYFLPPLLP